MNILKNTFILQDGEHAKHFLGKTEDVLTEINGISDEITRLQSSVKEVSCVAYIFIFNK